MEQTEWNEKTELAFDLLEGDPHQFGPFRQISLDRFRNGLEQLHIIVSSIITIHNKGSFNILIINLRLDCK